MFLGLIASSHCNVLTKLHSSHGHVVHRLNDFLGMLAENISSHVPFLAQNYGNDVKPTPTKKTGPRILEYKLVDPKGSKLV